MELIASGEQLAGIEQLERAYRLMPHPSVLYNIGLAFADLGMKRSAIDHFRLYLESTPEDGPTVIRLVVALEEQIEAEAHAAALAEEREAEDLRTPLNESLSRSEAEVNLLLERLQALIAAAETGLEESSESLEGGGADQPLDSKTESIYDQEIVSASRQTTNAVNAPAPTTIITAEEIRLSGATTLWDLLRRVPGMSVLTSDAGGADVAIRGFNQRVSNKILVLVDGRSVYLDFVGSTFFRTLSIGLQDIERIEVIRGPGATLYGASAFGGVVNIITRRPARDQEGQVMVRGGSGGILESSGRFEGRRPKLSWRGSVGYEQADRFEREFGDRTDLVASTEDVDLAVRTVRANGGVDFRPSDRVKLGFSGGAAYGYTSFLGIGVFRDFGMLGLHSDVRFDLQVGGFGLRSFWNHTNATTGPTWQRVGDRDLTSDLKTHTLDVEALYSGTEWTGSVRHDLAVGGGYRLKAVDWSFLSGPKLEQHLHGFIEDRISLVPEVAMVAGFRFDQHPLVGFTPSPRFALLLKPSSGQLIRASIGTAFRNPAFLESYADLVVPSGTVSGVGLHAQGNSQLRPEQIASVQVGYTFEESAYFSFGVEAYYQEISDLIVVGNVESSGTLPQRQEELFVGGSSAFLNEESLYHAMGGEVEVHAFPVDGLDLRASYSLSYVIDQARKDAGVEDFRDRRHPSNSGHFGASYRSPIGLDVNLDLHFVGEVTLPERSFDGNTGEVIVDSCDGDSYVLANGRLGYRFPTERFEIAFTATNIAGFFTEGHREHCLGSRVGGRAMGTVSYRF